MKDKNVIPFVKGLKTAEFGFGLVDSPVEYNSEDEVIAQYEVDMPLLANYFDIRLKDGQWMEFYSEYHLDRDELTAFAVLKDRDGGDTFYDYELFDDEAFYLFGLQTDFLKQNTPFQYISDYGETAKEVYSSILNIDEGDVINATINFSIGVTDDFLEKYCDTEKYPIKAEDEQDEYFHEFYLYKNVETGRLSFEDHVSNSDYSDSEILEIELPDTVAKCLYDAVCIIYQERNHEPLKEWENEIQEEYQR